MDVPTPLLARGVDSTLHARQREHRHEDSGHLSIDIDLELARLARVNVLIVGPAPEASALVRRLRAPGAADDEAVVRCGDGGMQLPAAAGKATTLVIHGVDALGSAEQRRLQQWLDDHAECGPIVSTAAAMRRPPETDGATTTSAPAL